MNRIKTFRESFQNTKLANSIIRKLDVPTKPSKPYIRKLTMDEVDWIIKNVKDHSFCSYVDSKNRVILGGGEGITGMYYIDASDLPKLKS